jgi:hypothetical protein
MELIRNKIKKQRYQEVMLMEVRLISHINGDADLLPAWFAYYTKLGVQSFHIIVHGSQEENSKLFELCKIFPVKIEAQYEGEFTIEKKRNTCNVAWNTTGIRGFF